MQIVIYIVVLQEEEEEEEDACGSSHGQGLLLRVPQDRSHWPGSGGFWRWFIFHCCIHVHQEIPCEHSPGPETGFTSWETSRASQRVNPRSSLVAEASPELQDMGFRPTCGGSAMLGRKRGFVETSKGLSHQGLLLFAVEKWIRPAENSSGWDIAAFLNPDFKKK